MCSEEKRKVLGYDISPTRADIKKSDARKIPLPDDTKAKLVFIDPPYGDNIRYNNEPANIGNISSEDESFYVELKKVMDESYRILDDGGVIGWLIGDQWVKKKFTPVGFKIYQKLLEAKFETVDIVSIYRRGQYSHTARALRLVWGKVLSNQTKRTTDDNHERRPQTTTTDGWILCTFTGDMNGRWRMEGWNKSNFQR